MKTFRVLAALVIVVLSSLCVSACGTPKPPPNVPPGESSCFEACRHIEHDLPLCGTTQADCLPVCQDAAGNSPEFPTCLARAQSCPALKACDP